LPYTSWMSYSNDGAAILLETRTGFEAETIAAALNARGIEARTVDTATAAALSNTVVRAKVLVPRASEMLARQVLEEIKAENDQIDWESMDLGPEEDVPRMHTARRGRRLLMTVCIVLVPIGLAVFALGTDRYDTTLQAIGGAVMLSALAVAMSLFAAMGKQSQEQD